MSSIANVVTLLQAAIIEAQSIVAPPPPPPPPPSGNLSTLAANTARNVGSFLSGFSGGGFITDFSGTCYDPVGNEVLLFGGGHGQGTETDIRGWSSQRTPGWRSLYSSTPWAAMTLANWDVDHGRWISTNQPGARHTYGDNCVVGRRFYILAWQAMPYDGPEPNIPWGGRIAWCQLDDPAFPWTYSKIAGNATPWGPYNDAVCLDPVSGKIVVVGESNNAGPGGIWLYDPVADSIVGGLFPTTRQFFSHRIVYFPPDGFFYIFSNYQSAITVWKMMLNRTNPQQSTLVNVTGTAPTIGGYCAYDYDSANRIIGGFAGQASVAADRMRFCAYDPTTQAWDVKTMQIEAGSAGTPYPVWRCSTFDKASGCFIFLNDPTSATTWAYRYK